MSVLPALFSRNVFELVVSAHDAGLWDYDDQLLAMHRRFQGIVSSGTRDGWTTEQVQSARSMAELCDSLLSRVGYGEG